ncbi:hypothetical protein F1880_004593 [Penicillium rolfsii]|nr:hypothetical protein F1880_004593 [Penicillium rolfsii]
MTILLQVIPLHCLLSDLLLLWVVLYLLVAADGSVRQQMMCVCLSVAVTTFGADGYALAANPVSVYSNPPKLPPEEATATVAEFRREVEDWRVPAPVYASAPHPWSADNKRSLLSAKAHPTDSTDEMDEISVDKTRGRSVPL